MSLGFLLVCQSLGLLQMASAMPSEPADSAAKGNQARLECAAGNVEAGIRLLAELWVANRNPTWIYNQGRCYEQNAKNDLAAAKFREYLRVAVSLPGDKVEEVRRHIGELEELERSPAAEPPLAPQAESPPARVPMPTASIDTQGEPPPALNVSSPTAGPSPTQPQSIDQQPLYTRWWVWAAGAAVVGASIAIVFLTTRDAPRSPSCDPGVPCATQH